MSLSGPFRDTPVEHLRGAVETDDDVARDVLGELYRESPEVLGVVDMRCAEVS